MKTLGVTAAQGFRAAAVTAGIKASGNPDMALVTNTGPIQHAAAVFTRNKIVAAPVSYTRTVVAHGRVVAALYNAGNANACTGQRGKENVIESAQRLARAIGCDPTEVAVCSTGLIGEQLPMDSIRSGIDSLPDKLGASAAHGRAAAEAIMTTDTVLKQTRVEGEGFVVGGMGKGVGMMAPSLATMLVCLTTDAVATPEMLERALHQAVAPTFNTLDIDGSTSTNDTVLFMASGATGVTPSQAELDHVVLAACEDLAQQMQADAEGVTKRVSIRVTGARNDAEALAAARTLGRDSLFKCAMFGSDPNWGRVLAAIGMTDAELDPEGVTVLFNDTAVCIDSTGVTGARDVDLSGPDIAVQVDLGTGGSGTGFVRTTDLSHAYVEINSAYST